MSKLRLCFENQTHRINPHGMRMKVSFSLVFVVVLATAWKRTIVEATEVLHSGQVVEVDDAQFVEVVALLDYETGYAFYVDNDFGGCIGGKLEGSDSFLVSENVSHFLAHDEAYRFPHSVRLFCRGLPIILLDEDSTAPPSKLRMKRSAPNEFSGQGGSSQSQVQGQVYGQGFFSGQAQSQNGISQSQVQLSGGGIVGNIASSAGNAQAQISLGEETGSGQAGTSGVGPSNSQVQVNLGRQGRSSMASASVLSNDDGSYPGGKPGWRPHVPRTYYDSDGRGNNGDQVTGQNNGHFGATQSPSFGQQSLGSQETNRNPYNSFYPNPSGAHHLPSFSNEGLQPLGPIPQNLNLHQPSGNNGFSSQGQSTFGHSSLPQMTTLPTQPSYQFPLDTNFVTTTIDPLPHSLTQRVRGRDTNSHYASSSPPFSRQYDTQSPYYNQGRHSASNIHSQSGVNNAFSRNGAQPQASASFQGAGQGQAQASSFGASQAQVQTVPLGTGSDRFYNQQPTRDRDNQYHNYGSGGDVHRYGSTNSHHHQVGSNGYSRRTESGYPRPYPSSAGNNGYGQSGYSGQYSGPSPPPYYSSQTNNLQHHSYTTLPPSHYRTYSSSSPSHGRNGRTDQSTNNDYSLRGTYQNGVTQAVHSYSGTGSPQVYFTTGNNNGNNGRLQCTIITFTCTIIIESDGRSKLCRPNNNSSSRANNNGHYDKRYQNGKSSQMC